MSEKLPDQNILTTAKIIWAAFLGSLVTYIVVCTIQVGPIEFSFDFSQILVVALTGMALFNLGLAQVIPKIVYKSGTGDLDLQSAPLGKLNEKYFVAFVIKLALLESIGVLGLILSFSMQKNLVIPYALVAAVGIFLSQPSEHKMRNGIV